MNIRKLIQHAALGSAILGLIGSPLALAGHRASEDGHETSGSGLVYTSTALSQAIFGYLNLEGAERDTIHPQIVYVDQAYGQAIYSYPRVAPDTTVAFNVHYVDQAYGPAIYSYPSLNDVRGRVEVLPMED
ncbi:hypothetical protein [Methylomagnum sp.]